MLVDDAADALPTAAIASAVEHRIGDNLGGGARAGMVRAFHGTRQPDQGRECATKLQRDGEEGPDWCASSRRSLDGGCRRHRGE